MLITLREIIQKKCPKSKVFQCENRGMDIGPFLFVMNYLIHNKAEYNYYIKIHTKTDSKWRNEMIQPIYNQLGYFLNTPPKNELELFGSKEQCLNVNFDMNYLPILELIKRNYPEHIVKFLDYCSKYNKDVLNCKEQPYFIAGTVFVFNNKYFDLFKQIKDINYEISIMEEGYSVNDFDNPRKTHAWEYLFGYIIYLNNKKINKLN